MKKYAMLLMGEHYDPQRDRCCFPTADTETHILTVRNPEEAVAKAAELADAGFGAIEVCGAFGADLARRMYEAAGGRVPVGYVICPADQQEANGRFWAS